MALLARPRGRRRVQVVVQDPYIDLHTGPGRGFPVTQVVDRGATIELLRQRTDWIKVRDAPRPARLGASLRSSSAP